MENKTYGFVFPGQGSQSVGMADALAKKFSEFGSIFQETLRVADAVLGFSLSSIIKEGPAERLKETPITQPALLTVSTAMGRWLKKMGIESKVNLGHSLGEYSALVHTESLSFEDAIRMVHLRGELMQSAVPLGVGGMAALLGANFDKASELCKAVQTDSRKILEISALNAPGQVVVSGHIEAIDLALKRTKEFGIRMATKLEVSGPFHSSLLEGAGRKLGEALELIEIQSPTQAVISNVTAQLETTTAAIRNNLVHQVSKTVRWEESLHYASKEFGIKHFIEVGAGKVLTGLVKKVLPEAECIPLELIENLPF